jgi:hypothetical protein
MEHEEESMLLLSTGCPPRVVERMLAFAERYRQTMSEDNVQKNRKLGTRSLMRIARRLAVDGGEDNAEGADLRAILSRSLLLEFLPGVERMNIDTLFDDAEVLRIAPAVRVFLVHIPSSRTDQSVPLAPPQPCDPR